MEMSYDTIRLMFQAREFHIASISAENVEERERYRRLAEKCEARIRASRTPVLAEAPSTSETRVARRPPTVVAGRLASA
jgi:hypothetical protein